MSAPYEDPGMEDVPEPPAGALGCVVRLRRRGDVDELLSITVDGEDCGTDLTALDHIPIGWQTWIVEDVA